jgi:hypothetical protein
MKQQTVQKKEHFKLLQSVQGILAQTARRNEYWNSQIVTTKANGKRSKYRWWKNLLLNPKTI